QPHILNRDDGLVGEGLQECNLVLGEATRLAAGYQDGPDRVGVTQDRDDGPASIAMETCSETRPLRHAGIDFVADGCERPPVPYRLRGEARGLKGLGKQRPNTGLTRFVRGFEGGEFDLISNDGGEITAICREQANRTSEDRVEHRLYVRLRLADDAQDV